MVHARFIVGDVPVSPDIRGCVHDLYANRLCPCGCGRTYYGSGGTEPEPALALAIRRRARDGQHAWTLDWAALRNPSRRSQGEVVRALIPALEHHAAIAVRCTAAGKIQADRWHWRYAARLQRVGAGEGRARSAGHPDGCNRPFRRAAPGVGRKKRVPVRHRTILRRLQTGRWEAEAGFYPATERY